MHGWFSSKYHKLKRNEINDSLTRVNRPVPTKNNQPRDRDKYKGTRRDNKQEASEIAAHFNV